MKYFINHLWIQLKMDIRDKGTLLTYYLVPLVFYAVMSAVFSSVNPEMKTTLSASMTIFAVTMGAVIGMPGPLVRMKESGVLRGFHVSGISSIMVFTVQAASAAIHLTIVSIIIFFASPAIYGAQKPANIFSYIIILIILLFTMLSIGMLIGSTAKNQSFATIMSQAVFLPTMMLGGIMFPSDLLPSPLHFFSYVIPSTYIIEAFSNSAYNLSTDMQSIAALAIALGIGFTALAATMIRCRLISKTGE